MASSTPNSLLGIGLYTPSEAAFYARVPTQTMNRWLFGNNMGDAVLQPQLEAQNERFVTFQDFVQALYLRHLRTEYRISLPRIRKGIEVAQKKYGVAHPLAMEKVMYLYGDELLIRLRGDREEEDSFVQVSGRQAHQRMLRQIVELYMKDIHFDAAGIAIKFRAYVHENIEIWMNPEFRLGEPLLANGYTARALWSAAKTEGGYEEAARAFGVSTDEVAAAYKYFDSLQVLRAA